VKHLVVCVGVGPTAGKIEQQGFGWKNKCGSGKGKTRLEGAWSSPIVWSIQYLSFLYSFESKKTISPGGATQWIPTDETSVNF
jgi:catalase-peroxidase